MITKTLAILALLATLSTQPVQPAPVGDTPDPTTLPKVCYFTPRESQPKLCFMTIEKVKP